MANLPVDQLRGAMGAAARKVEDFVRGNAKFQAAVEDAFNKVCGRLGVCACAGRSVVASARMCVHFRSAPPPLCRRSRAFRSLSHTHTCTHTPNKQ